MLLACEFCGSQNVNTLEDGDYDFPALLECEDCTEQYDDPNHPLARGEDD